jgi:hypothetical protein
VALEHKPTGLVRRWGAFVLQRVEVVVVTAAVPNDASVLDDMEKSNKKNLSISFVLGKVGQVERGASMIGKELM